MFHYYITGSESPWPTLTTRGTRLIVGNERGISSNGYANIENAANALVEDIMRNESEGGQELSGQQEYVTSGIDNVAVDRCQPTSHQPIYNLQGQQVAVPGKGVFIINHRKVVFQR